jgi:CHAT domain-containing protein/Tfp pilus assembly protein PilF
MRRGSRVIILLAGALAGFAAATGTDLPDKPGVRDNGAYTLAFRKGEEARARGDFESSIDRFQEALTISRQANDTAAEAACLMKLGLLQWNLGRIREAEGNFSEASRKAGTPGSDGVLFISRAALDIIRLYNQGKDLRLSNALPRSLEAFSEALAIGRRIKGEEFVAKCLRQMSGTYWQMNDLKSFLSNNEEALKIAMRLNLKIEQGRCLNNLGLYFWKSTDYSKALRHFQQALLILRPLNDSQTEAECVSNIGLISMNLGDYDNALIHFKNSLSIDLENGRALDVCKTYNNIGVVLEKKAYQSNIRSDFIEALGYFNRCLNMLSKSPDVKTEIEVLNNKGTIYINLNEYDTAISFFKLALSKANEQKNIEAIGNIYNNLGNVFLKMNRLNESRKLFSNAVDLPAIHLFKDTVWESYFGLGQCLEKRGDLVNALHYYQKSVDVIDTIRSRIFLETFKAGFARNKLGIFESLLNLLFRLSHEDPSGTRLEEMFVIVEKAKARAFLECLGEARIDFRVGLTQGLKEREEEISREISALILELSNPALRQAERGEKLKKLGRAEDESLRLISEMKAEQPGLVGLVSSDLYSIQRLRNEFLDEKTGLIEYFLGDARSYMFFITKNGVRLFDLPPREVIERSLRGYLKALSIPDRKGFTGRLAAERIADELLPPLAGLPVEGLKRLIIVPDGILYYLPFETLRPSGAPVSGYLIERFEISYAPSSSSLVFLSRKAAGPWRKTLLALGAPALTKAGTVDKEGHATAGWTVGEIYKGQGFDLSQLPFSKKEVLDIAGHFPKGSKDILLGTRAAEEDLKVLALEDYRIVHFACHGLLDEKVPFRSALILSVGRNDGEDGILQAREIYNLRLDADLVVLSACQTGRGSLERGEGLLGLPRMFFYAGSKSVVSTLWPIGDRSTAYFMDGFYEYLSRGYGKAAALRFAKVRMLRSKYAHPFHWAAFVLNGDFGPDSSREGRGRGSASVGQRSREKASNFDSPIFPSESSASTDQ